MPSKKEPIKIMLKRKRKFITETGRLAPDLPDRERLDWLMSGNATIAELEEELADAVDELARLRR